MKLNNMNEEEVIALFLNPKTTYTLRMGAKSLSKRYNTNIETIHLARRKVNEYLKYSKKHKGLPKVLILDIETAPIKAYVWGLWKQNVYLDQIQSDWFMLTWAAKWLFGNEIYSDKLTSEEALQEDDKRLVKGIWELLEKADIVIAHNGKHFDIPKMNARFIQNGLGPTTPYQTIDTLQVARKQFGFSSNKLEALARKFEIESKDATDFNLWKECMYGNTDALLYMETYNRQDTNILEEMYLKLRPWIKSHPNTGLYMETKESVCPNCGSNNIKTVGQYVTHVSKFNTFRCEDCGSIGRFRTNQVSKDISKNLTISITR